MPSRQESVPSRLNEADENRLDRFRIAEAATESKSSVRVGDWCFRAEKYGVHDSAGHVGQKLAISWVHGLHQRRWKTVSG